MDVGICVRIEEEKEGVQPWRRRDVSQDMMEGCAIEFESVLVRRVSVLRL